jgi:hypothetical protein
MNIINAFMNINRERGGRWRDIVGDGEGRRGRGREMEEREEREGWRGSRGEEEKEKGE